MVDAGSDSRSCPAVEQERWSWRSKDQRDRSQSNGDFGVLGSVHERLLDSRPRVGREENNVEHITCASMTVLDDHELCLAEVEGILPSQAEKVFHFDRLQLRLEARF